MTRRMVIRCDHCEQQADMVYPPQMFASAGTFGGPTLSNLTPAWSMQSMALSPPDGWFERFAGLQGTKDFCSVECVQAWDKKMPKDMAFA